jgi:hypothetical protein
MPSWEQLAEARIQEWLRRPADQRGGSAADAGIDPPLEVQLLQGILQLYSEAMAAKNAEAKAAALKRASSEETRLFILLEKAERPLAAQHLAGMLMKARARCQ